MGIEIDQIFTASAKSSWHFLIENGQGCYVPAYQRPYSWDKDEIGRLYEDILHGIRQLMYRPDTVSFLGTLIAIHDTRYRTVQPIYQSEVAPRVMTIIDGQQRISTIIMSNIVLHNVINKISTNFKSKNESHFCWIAEQCTQTLADLRNTYLIDRASGDGNYRYYPRIIRSYSDVWSRRRGQARYESPIARLIWEYIEFSEDGNVSQFKYNPIDVNGNIIPAYKMITNSFHFIQKEINKICNSNPNQYDFPNILTATQDENLINAIWGFDIPEEVKHYVAEQNNDKNYNNFCHLLRLIIFALYLNHRIAITVVNARNEDDAFDMFEALNTTGEPLTAFETFKPKVIEAETLKEYEHSPSYTWISQIKEYLDRFKKADEKQKATSEMFVPFALAETGWKLQKKLNDQRRYLRDEFDFISKLNDIEKNRSFVRSLASLASFMRYGWNAEGDYAFQNDPLSIYDEEALVGFEALRSKTFNHSIVIGPLSRFYEQAFTASTSQDRVKKVDEFIYAIKATIAFSVLWRGAMGGTKNIESHYRDIMRSGINIGEINIPPFARRPERSSGSLSLSNYKQALRTILEHRGKVQTKDNWVQRVSSIGIYQHSSILARFLLYCATDDAVPDRIQSGLIKRGRSGYNPMLTLGQWRNQDYFTIEHIAPKSQSTGWDSRIYEEAHIVDTLGNLTLLPLEANNIIGNKSWEHKKLMYKLLSSETNAEFDQTKEQLGSVGLSISKTADQIFKNAKYLGICKSVALFDNPWSIDIINKRTNRLAELAWDRISPWLFS